MTTMTEGPILSTIVRFSLPLSMANLLQQGYLLADSVIVGRYVGVGGLAAIGASGPLFYLLNATFLGIATAFSIRVAQMKGSGRTEGLSAVVVALGILTVGWSLICVVLASVFARPMLGLMGIHGQLAHDSRVFLLTLSIGFIAMFGMGAVCALLRGLGNSRTPMYILIFSSALNIVVAWLFVGPLHLGLPGAALATVIASFVAVSIGLGYTRRAYPLDRRWSAAQVRREIADGLRLGLPLATQHILLAGGIMVLVWIITPYGTAFLAAFTVVGRLELFTALIFLDLSGALTAFVAQNLGAGQEGRIRQGLRQVIGLTFVLTLAMSAVLLLARAPIAAIFTDDQGVRDLTAQYIVITYPFFALYTIMVVIHGCLNGLGRTVVPLICTVLSFLLAQVPLAYLLGGPFGITGVMWAVVIGWSVGFGYSIAASYRQLTVPGVRVA
jgi:putative MATE family efflux protein